jgi:signal transduction histidine kinase/CheY-like chemotaxis protein
VLARQRARQLGGLLGLDRQDQTRVATAVSEMARNAVKYAGAGRVEFSLRGDPPTALEVRVSDKGPGIAELQSVLDGRYQSRTGMGLGIVGARRLMDAFEIRSSAAGTEVVLVKQLARRGGSEPGERVARLVAELARQQPIDPIEEVQQQNQELLGTLEELRRQREELAQANRELEATNRGVVALYAELDERADDLQRANEIKTRFLSNMTHEFRTPLNSILSLARLLLDRLDGELTPEQEKQVRFIQGSAENLGELVSDLLDLSKVAAGKIVIRPAEFRVGELFGTLRGMLRPLLSRGGPVELVFEAPPDLPPMHTDESKVAQILRNFISNALKYTERGEVRVSARAGAGGTVVFSVSDTGIGIAAQDQERIFEEYSQVEHPLQQSVRGTGLGLPLSRRLAALLGGSVGVRSEPGRGSTFHALIPARFDGPTELPLVPEVSRRLDPTRLPVLVVDENREALFAYEKCLRGTSYQVLPARTLAEARDWLRSLRPVAVVLDITLEGECAWDFLAQLRGQGGGPEVPVIVVTLADDEPRALALGAAAFHVKPVEREWLVGRLAELAARPEQDRLLVIDDDEVSRYLLRGLLSETRFGVIEAQGAREGLRLALEAQPRAIVLDLVMPEADGFAVLESLKADPRTREIPVVVHTSKSLGEADLERLQAAAAIVAKQSASREEALASLRSALVQAGVATTRETARETARAGRESGVGT